MKFTTLLLLVLSAASLARKGREETLQEIIKRHQKENPIKHRAALNYAQINDGVWNAASKRMGESYANKLRNLGTDILPPLQKDDDSQYQGQSKHHQGQNSQYRGQNKHHPGLRGISKAKKAGSKLKEKLPSLKKDNPSQSNYYSDQSTHHSDLSQGLPSINKQKHTSKGSNSKQHQTSTGVFSFDKWDQTQKEMNQHHDDILKIFENRLNGKDY